MDVFAPGSGWLEVISGPMFSGKTEELIRRLRRAEIAGKRVQAFKPTADDRFSESELVTHNDVRMHSIPANSAQEILQKLSGKTEVVGIDEAHFFGPALVDAVSDMADSGRQIIVAGVDTDFLGRPFPPMPELLALAESITKLLAICVVCGAPAKHSQRIVDSPDLIFVGAVDAYEARCRRCFEPEPSRQERLDFAPVLKS